MSDEKTRAEDPKGGAGGGGGGIETTMMIVRGSFTEETSAMVALADAILPLNAEQRERVIAWAIGYFQLWPNGRGRF